MKMQTPSKKPRGLSSSQPGDFDMATIMRLMIIAAAMMLSLSIVQWAVNIKYRDVTNVVSLHSASVTDIDRKLECMTRNIYMEAANEPAEGKIAVAQVVMNRASSPLFPHDVCQVINQKTVFHSVVVCQFSWLCDGSSKARVINQAMWEESRVAAKKVMLEGFRLPSLQHALYYHADYVNPRWPLKEVARIGRHIFYKPKSQDI
jgi:spore germination cell wall hydrolase CwlJ-like protein